MPRYNFFPKRCGYTPSYLLASIAVLLMSAFLFHACDTTDPDNTSETEIRTAIYEITNAFNWNNVDEIMALVHNDYLHKGMYRNQLQQLWLDRRALYTNLETTIWSVNINSDRATVNMRMTFSGPGVPTLILDEPQSSGDASFFFQDGQSWVLYGDQGWGK
jgi:hypothetical protein